MRRTPLPLLLLLSVTAGFAAEIPHDQVEFFEKKIRPILVDKCYSCHSVKAEKIKGELLLDSRAATLKGGANGPAVIPGNVEKSLIVKAVRYKEEKLQMPPDEQLGEAQVADIAAWVAMGAPDPRSEATSLTPDPAKAKKFWSFQAPKLPPEPKLKNEVAGLSPIDRHVRAKLESKGIVPSAQADKRTLIRRASFDLTGLPPTPEETDAFIADASPDAFAKVVDRLLASPQYGERWARYWLDIARYADTKGYVFEEERRYPYSYVYRDWVIRAINEDLPYDQFIVKQVAADKLPPSPENRDLAAMGFLLLGRRFLNNQADIIDDRMDVLIRGTQGLTIGCARCHDHKFDPLTQQDYYGLYGIFAASQEPKELPVVGHAEHTAAGDQYDKEVKAKEEELEKLRHDIHARKLAELRTEKSLTNYLAAYAELRGTPDDKIGGQMQKRDLNHHTYNRWRDYLKNHVKPDDPIWAPFAELLALKDADFAAKAPELCARFATDSEHKLNGQVSKAFQEKKPANVKELTALYGALLSRNAKPEAQKDDAAEKLRLVLFGSDAPSNVPFSEVQQLMNREDHNKERDVRKKIDALAVTHPGAPPRAMTLSDAAAPGVQHVFLRGDPNRQGPEAPRRFLEILAGAQRPVYKTGSGRLELAQAIASRDNPLTARVMVNRIWMHHFGAPLLRTPSDFGVRSDPPVNQELLDYLAVSFMNNGWSLKKLHREIMLSQTYRQSSEDNPEARKIDSENALLWRFNRQRLDFEAMRDALLSTSGLLDKNLAGRSVDLSAQPFTHRRSVYGYIDRQNLPGMFRAFDFASPDTHSPQRFNTTVPQQALYLMNSPFVIEQARALAVRSQSAGEDIPARITALYRAVFLRAPSAEEVAIGGGYIQRVRDEAGEAPGARPSPWQYGYGTFDESTHRTASFTPLPHFTGTEWQGGPKLPDPKLGWVLLIRDGGHPGDPKHAAIRRWVAPRDGTFAVTGTLNHPNKVGDGVRGRIVASSEGDKGTWLVQNSSAQTPVDKVALKKGQTLDFIVDCRADENSDSFTWKVVVKMLDYGASFSDEHGGIEWNSATQFAGPPGTPVKALSAWEKYAQVLLLSNEFIFVD